jgi:uncharacterized protein with HEPN domain
MREDNEKLRDMLEAIARINKYVGLGRNAFEESELIQTWYVRHLEIVGEAARNLSDDARKAATDVPWKEIIGMRNILAHNYSKFPTKNRSTFSLDFSLFLFSKKSCTNLN